MKKILLLISLPFIFSAGHSQTQSIPYCDNFNGATLWTVTTISGSAWQQGSPNYGLTNSSHTPPNCFDVELSAAYLPNTVTYLTSPAINFSSAPNSKLSFWQNRNTESYWDGARMEYSTDSGTIWIVLGAVADPNATNWYNRLIINSSNLPAWDSISAGWVKSTYNLNFLSGTPIVMFRFVFTSDPSVQADGFSIDDFCVTLPPDTDIGVDSILSPQSPATAGASIPVQVRVRNYGLLAASNFNVYYKVDNGATVGPTNYAGSIAPGATVNVTCANLTIPSGSHTISAYTVIVNDGDQFNDTTSKVINGFSSSTLSYCNNFDGVNNDWIAIPIAGSTNNWELGTPNYGVTSSAHSVPNSWDVNLNTTCGIGGADLYSPIFDFNTATNCSLEFWQNNGTNLNTDGTTLLSSINSAPFAVLGTVGDPNATNWYTTAALPASNYPGWSGVSTGWFKSTYNLSGFNNAGLVQFQFHYIGNSTNNGYSIDDFCIIQPQPIDAGVEQILEPNISVPANSSQQVKVRVKNYGTQTFNSFTVAYQLDGGIAVGPVNFPLPLTPNSSADVTLPGVTIPSGLHTLCAYTTLAGDGNYFNDTMCINTTGVSIVSLPYTENFDLSNVGWTTSAINTATVWELGTPNFGATNSAYSAPNCWDINLNTGYQSQAIATLTSPYFDFTIAVDAKLKFFANYNTELNWDGVRCEYRATDSIWHMLGAIGSLGSTNWYNGNLNSSGMAGWAGNSGGWQQCGFDSLNMLTGAADVQFRFIFTSDFSINLDGFSIDNFEITIPLSNSAGTQAINTNNILVTPSPQYFQALIVNRGSLVLNTVSVSLRVDNTTVITETPTLTPPLNYNESRWYSFISSCNVTPGAHTVCVYTSNPNGVADLNTYDDTTCYPYTVLDSASVFPYCNDFENSTAWPVFNPQTWAPDNLWQAGTPFKPIINNAHSGVKCWITDLFSGYGANKSSALISPVFYVQQGHCYRLNFWHEFNTEYLKDGGTVEFSYDHGSSWIALGLAGDPTWFNTNYVVAFGNPPTVSGWSGTQATWTNAQHDIFVPVTGEYIFRFRFGSNANNNGYDGWAIDDICLEDLGSPCTLGIADYNGNDFYLSQNEPNPANETATIHFNLNNKNAQLRITDMLGNTVFEKDVEGNQLTLDLRNFKNGIYFYELLCGENRLVKKMTVVK